MTTAQVAGLLVGGTVGQRSRIATANARACGFLPLCLSYRHPRHFMSDAIKHECGLAFIRLRKPLSHYQERHGSALYGLTKLYLLMEKQHNRGQDGAGVATIKLDPPPGTAFIDRERSTAKNAIPLIFGKINQGIAAAIEIGRA